MLDFLFQLGQLVSLLGLASGFLLTIRYRNWVHEASPTQSRMTETNLLASHSQADQLTVSLIASDAEPRHRDTVAA